MSDIRKLKKSESLEIRLPYPTKQAFMARCQAEGRSASEALRGFIEAELSPAAAVRPLRRLRYLAAGGLLAAALGAVAAPSLARPGADAQFRAMDADLDGAVSAAEFDRLDADGDGQLSLAEFTTAPARSGRP